MKPELSIILPLYNGETTLQEAISSVLQQDVLPSYEWVIINDGSTDRSLEILESLALENLQYISQDNAGPATARNKGIEKARASTIAFIDADDRWPRQKLSLQWPRIQQDSIDCSMGLTQFTWEGQAAQSEPKPKFENNKDCLIGPFLGSLLVKKKVFDSIGLFDPDLSTGEDLDWLMRLRESSFNIDHIQEVSLIYRRHDLNMTRGMEKDIHENNLKILKRSLDRKRQSST